MSDILYPDNPSLHNMWLFNIQMPIFQKFPELSANDTIGDLFFIPTSLAQPLLKYHPVPETDFRKI